MTCTFFGHANTPDGVLPLLRKTLTTLIVENQVEKFYVGTHGNFDHLVQRTLSELETLYPISYFIVQAYLPRKKTTEGHPSSMHTILPEGIETVLPRFAITWRNKWMIQQSDYVVTYITHNHGGAAQFQDVALRKGKTVINLAK